MAGGSRCVFLDRDGVLCRAIVRNGKPFPPRTPEELEVMPDAPEACRALLSEGFALIMVTNQPDVARGSLTLGTVDAINHRLRKQLGLISVKTCPHDDPEDCACRKPRPGMLLEAARELNLVLADSFVIGDRWRDIEAGRRAGCRTVLIDYGYQEDCRVEPDYRAKSLAEAAAWILGAARRSQGKPE